MSDGRDARLPTGRRMSDVCGGRDNNLNLLRMTAASAVLISHSFSITYGSGALEPLVKSTGRSLGSFAVSVFFVISGFLIARSFDRKVSLPHWLAARFFRLFPALALVLFLTVFVLAPLVSTLPLRTLFSHVSTWTYIPRNLSLAFMQYSLPGVFEKNRYPSAINGSLWTLFYEVSCYGLVLMAGITGLLQRRRLLGAALSILLLAGAIALSTGTVNAGIESRLQAFLCLAFPFGIGIAAYVWRYELVLDSKVALGLAFLCALSSETRAFDTILMIVVCYATLWVAYIPNGIIRRYNLLGDYSYGFYIYAFPIQQLVSHLWPGLEWYQNILFSGPATLLCAVLSWQAVEANSIAFAKPGGGLWRLLARHARSG